MTDERDLFVVDFTDRRTGPSRPTSNPARTVKLYGRSGDEVEAARSSDAGAAPLPDALQGKELAVLGRAGWNRTLVTEVGEDRSKRSPSPKAFARTTAAFSQVPWH